MSNKDFEEFFEHYLIALLWSTSVMIEDDEMLCLDDAYGTIDINSDSRKELENYAREFYLDTLVLFAQTPESYTLEQHGHDFALTSNGHGTGYWDRGLGEIGEQLTAASKPYSAELYIGDNNELYV